MRLEQNLKQQPYREDWQRHYALQTEQIQKAIQLNSETSLDGAIKQIYSAKRIFLYERAKRTAGCSVPYAQFKSDAREQQADDCRFERLD